MTDVRPPAVAGLFYPHEPGLLAAEVRAMLGAGGPWAADTPPPKALIVPHAGFAYSGAVAGAAYRRLSGAGPRIRRVVLFGPAHRVHMPGLALPTDGVFATPLGPVEIDRQAAAAALALPQVSRSFHAHALEHSLEVQLPFLQEVLPSFRIVPFAVGEAKPALVAEVIELLYGGPETLIVVSSDLSHFHPDTEARRIDSASARDILALSATIDYEGACGAPAINALLLVARRHGLVPDLLAQRNSGDATGDRARVVGYASFAFTDAGHGHR